MLNKRNSFILGLLFAVLIVEIVILSPKEIGKPADVEKPKQAQLAKNKKSNKAAGQTMQGVSSVGSKGDKKEWELNAKQALQAEASDIWEIEQVQVKFFAEDGVVYNVTGDQGEVDVKKNNIKLSGNVVTRSSNGYVFKAEVMYYDSARRRLTCPEKVRMTGPVESDGTKLVLTGADMVADMLSNEISISKRVTASKGIKDGKVATIASNSARFSGRTNSARFVGNVTIDVDSLRITGPEAQFIYSPDGGVVESVTVNGGVKVTDVDKWATSEKVSVHFIDDKFVFNGAPRVVQSGDELIGDEIVFLDGGKRVQVSNARAKIEPNSAEKATR